MLVHVRFSQLEEQEEIAEFEELVRSADIEQLAILIARRKRPDARLFIGSGKLEELRALLTAHSADLVVVDHDLTPSLGAMLAITVRVGLLAAWHVGGDAGQLRRLCRRPGHRLCAVGRASSRARRRWCCCWQG